MTLRGNPQACLGASRLYMRLMATHMLSKSVSASMGITRSDPHSTRGTSMKAAAPRSRSQSPRADFSYGRESVEEM